MASKQRAPDMGMRVVSAAKAITPEQVATLLAIKHANMHKTQVPTGPYHWVDREPQAVLRNLGMVTAEKVKGWSGKGWQRARITEFGERVLLSVAEDAMIAQGRMPADPPPEQP